MMVSLLCRTNQLTFLILISFVVIIYCPNFLTVLVSSSNMWKLKYSILTDCMESSIPPLLDLSPIGSPTLYPKETWKYLGFIFDRKLMIYQHIDHYLNKAISLVKCMKLLGNLSREINPVQKCQLYRCYILPIALYGFQFWFYNKVPLSYHMKILGKMQRRTAIWILEAFKTLPTEDIEAIARIIPIKFHL